MALVEELGRDYVDQFYRNAYFLMDDKIHIYSGHIDRQNVQTQSIKLKGTSSRWGNDTVPSEKLRNMDVFGWPKLGYRTFLVNGVRVPYYAYTQRSAMRGLKDEFLMFDGPDNLRLYPSITHSSLKDWVTSAVYMRAVYDPSYPTFKEAVKNIREGVSFGEAISEDMAVVVSASPDNPHGIDVVFRQRTVGKVTEKDEVVIPHKYAKRASSVRLFGSNMV